MDPASRIHYGKMYTVEHNVKVCNFGMVHPDHIPIVIAQWRQFLDWEKNDSTSQYTSGPSQQDNSSPPAVPVTPASTFPSYVDLGYVTTAYVPGENADRQISLQQHDRLAILEWPYPGWAKAWNQRSGETGLVPQQYITLYQSATPLYPYRPVDTAGAIELQLGDQLRIVGLPNNEWAKVWNQRTAETGIVPRNYISRSPT